MFFMQRWGKMDGNTRQRQWALDFALVGVLFLVFLFDRFIHVQPANVDERMSPHDRPRLLHAEN
jgi:hypothetical protein